MNTTTTTTPRPDGLLKAQARADELRTLAGTRMLTGDEIDELINLAASSPEGSRFTAIPATPQAAAAGERPDWENMEDADLSRHFARAFYEANQWTPEREDIFDQRREEMEAA